MNNVLQALMYFFKNTDKHASLNLDDKALIAELEQLGFCLADVEKLLSNMLQWIASHSPTTAPAASLSYPQEQPLNNYPTQPHGGLRVYTDYERFKISVKSRKFLAKIERMGILSPQMREAVIDQLMHFEIGENPEEDQKIRLSHTKWVTFQTLFHDAPPVHVAYLEWLLFSKVAALH